MEEESIFFLHNQVASSSLEKSLIFILAKIIDSCPPRSRSTAVTSS